MKYITGMNRDRDSYQVAQALAEHELLSLLVTDYYAGSSLIRYKSLSHRSNRAVPPTLVRTVPVAFGLQVAHRIGRRRLSKRLPFPSRRIDDSIARVIEAEASRRPEDGLLVYSNYAYRAFEFSPSPVKVLFQYHPGATIIRQGLDVDELGSASSWEKEPEESERGYRSDVYARELGLAHRIICASSFTARGLLADGYPRAQIDVVPYGCPRVARREVERERIVLFVGQGVQRKGLHLLLAAWGRLAPRGWKLRIVASRMDPAIAEFARRSSLESVEISGPVSADELDRLYWSADTVVLPSLVEGFGLVLGEALARGCRLIATTNTGLPDMSLPAGIADVIAPGSVQDIADALSRTFDTYDRSDDTARLAAEASVQRSWEAFRSGVRAALP